MKKFVLLCMALLLCTIPIISSATNINAYATTASSTLKIRAYGDSISYGETLSDINNAYPAVFSQTYINKFGAEFTPKGVSGDTSTDLLNDLEPYKDGTASDLQEFNETDIVTLCIGANNVLGPALNNLSDFLLGSISESDLQQLLDAGVEQFKEDYPEILEILSNKEVVVMTIYNPYKYLSLNDITIASSLSSYQATISSILTNYQVKLDKLLEMSMTSLQIINNEIRASASNNVQVVDIWEHFSTLTKEQYLEYINADISKVEISSLGDVYPDPTTLLNKIVLNCDPHPTKEGHAFIAQKHTEEFKCFNFSFSSTTITSRNDNLTLTLSSALDKNFSYKIYKTTSTTPVLLKETNDNVVTFKAGELEGNNSIYAEIYLNNKLLEKTNTIQINLDFSKQTLDFSALIYIAILIILIVITVLIFIIVQASTPKSGKL